MDHNHEISNSMTHFCFCMSVKLDLKHILKKQVSNSVVSAAN